MLDLYDLRKYVAKYQRGGDVKMMSKHVLELVERLEFAEVELVKARELLSGKRSEGEVDATDENLATLWTTAGGEFHGPNIETGCMPQKSLFNFLREIMFTRAVRNTPDWGVRRTLPPTIEQVGEEYGARFTAGSEIAKGGWFAGFNYAMSSQFKEVGHIAQKKQNTQSGTYEQTLSIHRYNVRLFPDLDINVSAKVFVSVGEIEK